jgi:uncharacterized Zn-binding protein involved in type VI secretion
VPGLLCNGGMTAMCPHGGPVQVVPGNPRVLLGGMPAATLSDTYLIAGCAFTVGPKLQPCVKVQWLVPAARVLIGGSPAVTRASTGLCQSADQIPAGPPSILMTQMRVSGT